MPSSALRSANLTLLGDCALTIDDVSVPGVPANLFRTVAYLILSPSAGALPRHRLSALLWSHLNERKAAANMRQLVARIRHLQETHNVELVAADATEMKLATSGQVSCDLAKLVEGLQGRQNLTPLDVCNLYRGELLSGLDEAGEGYQEWLVRQRGMLHADVVDRLSAALRDSQLSCGERAACARRMQMLDPYNEEALQVLLCEAAEHQQLARFRQLYATACAVLADDLGLKPSPETQALYSELHASLTAVSITQARS